MDLNPYQSPRVTDPQQPGNRPLSDSFSICLLAIDIASLGVILAVLAALLMAARVH